MPAPYTLSLAPPSPASALGAGLFARLGRQISAGHVPPPGAYSRKPAWWSRRDWAGVEVWCVVAANVDVCQAVHADPHTVVRVARAMATYADHATGRDCRPTNPRLAADLRMSVRQIQRARTALKRLQLVVELVAGRSVMTKAERLAAWRRGSSHRRLAATFALLSVRRRPQPAGPAVDRVTPPGAPPGLSFNPANLLSSAHTNRQRTGAARRATRKGVAAERAYPAEVKSRRLIAGLQQRISWLRAVSPRRLTCLHRFAAAGWTPRDIQTAADEVLRARYWSVPAQLTQPAAYLACLLRDVDPADRPGAAEDAKHAHELAVRDWHHQTTRGRRFCPHGHPGGNIPHPAHGHYACPNCRHDVNTQPNT